MASLIKKISEINAVSGNESELRRYLTEHLKADSITVDSIGNVVAMKKGTDRQGRIMVVTHMDEAGFIVSGITEKGYLRFKPVGNIDMNTVISKKVVIGKDQVKGVIGMKAIHLQTREERQNTVPASKLFIDIGSKSKKEALQQVQLVYFITFDTKCARANGIIKGKALSRCGIIPVLGEMEKISGSELYFVFTAQKETGMRGASILARQIEPDAVITVDTAATDDTFGTKPENRTIRLGGGVIIPAMDRYSIYDRELLEKTEKLAKELKLPYQKAIIKQEFADTGAIQYGANGARCVNLSIPCRYAKTPVEMVSEKDLLTTELLLGGLIENIDEWTEGK